MEMGEREPPRPVDPFSDSTRRVRRNLLVASFVAIALSVGGLTPQSINALGIEFGAVELTRLFWLLGSIVVFELVSFVACAVPEFQTWRLDIEHRRAELFRRVEPPRPAYQAESDTGRRVGLALQIEWAKWAHIRLAVDVALPVGIGAGSIACLVLAGW
jgi:hypothetical protein